MADPLTACRRVRSGLGDRAACATHARPWPCRIRALSLTRPWTELVIAGLKTIENRSWAPHELGVIVVHAAKSWDDAALNLVNEFAGDGMLTADDYAVLDDCALHRDAPTGYLGIATIAGCHFAGDLICVSRETPWTPTGRCSHWAFDGSYHWDLVDARRFPDGEIVPGGGSLGLFTPPDDVVGHLRDLMWEMGCRD